MQLEGKAITPNETKNQIWERNHNQITWAISVLMQEYGRMPTTAEIVNKSELSRQTIHKHLKDYATDPKFLEITEQFKIYVFKSIGKSFQICKRIVVWSPYGTVQTIISASMQPETWNGETSMALLVTLLYAVVLSAIGIKKFQWTSR